MSSTSTSSSHPHPPVTQKVFGPGVTKARKAATPAVAAQKKKTSSQVQKKKNMKIEDLKGLNLSADSIYWVTPAPGYGNPINLSSIPENNGKVFTKWLSWESADRIGYTLIDAHEVKYWADAASIHMLSQAKLAGIDHEFFNFIVFREGKGYKYGFIPREFVPDEKIQSFKRFRNEIHQVKTEEEEEEKNQQVNTTTNTAATTSNEEEDEEDPIADIDLTTLD